MKPINSLNFLGAFTSFGVASCCVLPMVMILLGLGGSWLAIFGKLAALSPYVLSASTLLALLAWWVALDRGSEKRLRRWLSFCTALIAVSWVVYMFEAQINDRLMTWM